MTEPTRIGTQNSTGEIGTYDSSGSPVTISMDGGQLWDLRPFADIYASTDRVTVHVQGPNGWSVLVGTFQNDATDYIDVDSVLDSHGSLANGDNVRVWSTLDADTLDTVEVTPGFMNDEKGTLAFTDGTRTLTWSFTSSFSVVSDGLVHNYSGSPLTSVIPDTEGLHFFYIDGDGLLQNSTTFSDTLLYTYALVAAVYWSTAQAVAILVLDERHRRIGSEIHYYLHEAISATIVGNGFSPGNYIVDGNGSLDTHCQISVADGVLRDEDIRNSITDGSPQDLSTILVAPVLYRDGAAGGWRKFADTNSMIRQAGGTGLAVYNEWTGTTWQQTTCSNRRYLLAHLIVTNDVYRPLCWIQGQNEYRNAQAARIGAETEAVSLALGGLAALGPEMVQIATFIVQTRTSYSNTYSSRLVSAEDGDYVDWRERLVGFGGVASTAYGSLLTAQSVVTTADLTLSTNTVEQVDPSGLTADRSIVLPAGATAGQTCGFVLTAATPAAYELVLKGDTGVTVQGYGGAFTATEATRLCMREESALFMSDGADTWLVLRDGRTPQTCSLNATPTMTALSSWEVLDLSAANIDIDNADLDDTANDRIYVRRDGVYILSVGIKWPTAGAGKTLFCAYNINGTKPSANRRMAVVATAASSSTIALNVTNPVKLSAGDYVQAEGWQNGSTSESVNMFLDITEQL